MVIGTIALLVSLLLPAISGARRSARTVACASNIRQLALALIHYQQEHEARFPRNVSSPAPGEFWCQASTIGEYLAAEEVTPVHHLGLGVFVCPADDGAARSYSMNVWASSQANTTVVKATPKRGCLWESFAVRSEKIILIVERWSTIQSDYGYLAPQTVGFAGLKPGQRFGADGGVGPPVNAGRFGVVPSEIDYTRHSRVDALTSVPADAMVNIGYADGHVETHYAGHLADFQTGLSTLEALWSPMDEQLNQ